MPQLRDYAGKLVIPAAAATSLITLLQAEGFTKTALAESITIKNGSVGILYKGQSNVSAANGYPIAASAEHPVPTPSNGYIDLTQIYLFSTAGDSIFVDVVGLK